MISAGSYFRTCLMLVRLRARSRRSTPDRSAYTTLPHVFVRYCPASFAAPNRKIPVFQALTSPVLLSPSARRKAAAPRSSRYLHRGLPMETPRTTQCWMLNLALRAGPSKVKPRECTARPHALFVSVSCELLSPTLCAGSHKFGLGFEGGDRCARASRRRHSHKERRTGNDQPHTGITDIYVTEHWVLMGAHTPSGESIAEHVHAYQGRGCT